MAGRTRTTKTLAQRIKLDYFKKTFPIPYWRRMLSLILTVVGLAWLGWDGLNGKQAFNAGPLSHGHKIVTGTCESCHSQPSFWGTKTSDMACLRCHDAPVHQAKQTFTPECTSCHVDHQKSFKLAATTEASCTQCHSDLKVKDGKTEYATNIKSFSSGHPEFVAVKAGHPIDPGTLKLNHQIHLKKDLRGPDGKPVQMGCSDCHQLLTPMPPVTVAPADSGTTSADELQQMAIRANLHGLSPEMAPITFEKHCMSCHPLLFDKRFPDPAPHKETRIVQDYVVKTYTDYIAAHPDQVHEPLQLNPDLPTRPIPPPPRNATEWIAQRVEEADRLLWQKSCKECHILTYPAPSARPEVPKSNVTVRWMKNAWFDHKPHQLVACAECHTQAPNSQKTEDVLLPVIATCQKCHYDGSQAAESRCYECHAYHDWTKAKPVKNTDPISKFGR
jgi:hypothetical protein